MEWVGEICSKEETYEILQLASVEDVLRRRDRMNIGDIWCMAFT